MLSTCSCYGPVQVLGPGFGSFYGTFVPLAKEILSSTPPVDDTPPDARVSGGGGVSDGSGAGPQNTDILRGKAMEAIALMGQAVGLEIFRADAHQASVCLVSCRVVLCCDLFSFRVLCVPSHIESYCFVSCCIIARTRRLCTCTARSSDSGNTRG